jgi:hypothetical protein
MRRLEALQFVDEQSFQLRSAPTGRVTQDRSGGWAGGTRLRMPWPWSIRLQMRPATGRKPQDVTTRLFPTAAVYARFINPHRTRAPV